MRIIAAVQWKVANFLLIHDVTDARLRRVHQRRFSADDNRLAHLRNAEGEIDHRLLADGEVDAGANTRLEAFELGTHFVAAQAQVRRAVFPAKIRRHRTRFTGIEVFHRQGDAGKSGLRFIGDRS